MIYLLDLIGTLVFAISGTLVASEKKMDLFGATFIGFITAIGGGTIRDIMIGVMPVSWITDINYFYSIIVGVLLTIFLKNYLSKLRKTIFLFDTIGISVFTVLGIQKALDNDIILPIAILFGVISAVVGGIMRDIICNEVPLILRKEIYASACLIGGLVYVTLDELCISHNFNFIITTFIILTIRLLSVKYKLKLYSM